MISPIPRVSAWARCDNKSSPYTYGSNSFGHWELDLHQNPSFIYTCDQTQDNRACTSLWPGLLSETDHVHQIGNDRLIGIASNYGWVSVRQDEGGMKILNAVEPGRAQWGGGIGWLCERRGLDDHGDGSGGEMISTYYSGEGEDNQMNGYHGVARPGRFKRTFGMGYLRKEVQGQSFDVDQIVHAPFGDDPVMISQITITNRSQAQKQVSWTEYWGCHVYQLSFRLYVMARRTGKNVAELRHEFGDRFEHQFDTMAGSVGLVEGKKWMGADPAVEREWDTLKPLLKEEPSMFAGGEVTAPLDNVMSWEDLSPPKTFLASLDAPADGMATDGAKFFGNGGVLRPDRVSRLDGSLASSGPGSALLLQRDLSLKPGESRTIYFLFGYASGSMDHTALVKKYGNLHQTIWSDSGKRWRDSGLKLSTSDDWVARESKWNYYYLRSGQTFDTYFQEHIIKQAGQTVYVMGTNSTSRDPLQHVMPFIFSDPKLVKETIRYTLKMMRPDGSIYFGIVGDGMPMPTVMDDASDIPLFLLWLISEYVLATRDVAFLDEEIQSYPQFSEESSTTAVRDLLHRTFRCLTEIIGYGEHGLIRQKQDDWNDAIVTLWVEQDHRAECVEVGESVMNSAMASYIFRHFGTMLRYAEGHSMEAVEAVEAAEKCHNATREQWTGKWFRRAWLGPASGWLGERNIWLEPQPWALISGITDEDTTHTLVESIDTMLRQPSTLGAMQQNGDGERMAGSDPRPLGMSINGGCWPPLNATLIWGLAHHGYGEMAWDEFKQNSLAQHGEVYPDIWYGTWSALDSVNAACSPRAGRASHSQTFNQEDWPVMNAHSHAAQLLATTKLIGLEFTELGLSFAPVLPLDTYSFESPLVGFSRTQTGYEGWYDPILNGEWVVKIRLPEEELARVCQISLHGAGQTCVSRDIIFRGCGGSGNSLRWKVVIAKETSVLH